MNKRILVIVGLVVLGLAAWAIADQNKDKTTEPTTATNTQQEGVRTAKVSGHPEWSPIMYKDGEVITGAGSALVKMIFDELNIKTEYPYSGTWDEVQAKAKSGEVDVLVAAYKTEERVGYMDYSDAYTTDPVAVFVKAGSALTFEKLEDLAAKKGVGTVGDSYGQVFDDAIVKGKPNFTTVQTSTAAFDAVASGQADYFVYSLFAGERELRARGREAQFTRLSKFAAEENFYVTMSKKSPLVSRMADINRLIAKYKADGAVDRLITEYKAK